MIKVKAHSRGVLAVVALIVSEVGTKLVSIGSGGHSVTAGVSEGCGIKEGIAVLLEVAFSGCSG